MPAPAHVRVASLDKFLTSWENSNPKDTIALWSDECTQKTLPLSLSMPANSRAEAEAIYPNLVKSLTNWQVSSSQFVPSDCFSHQDRVVDLS